MAYKCDDPYVPYAECKAKGDAAEAAEKKRKDDEPGMLKRAWNGVKGSVNFNGISAKRQKDIDTASGYSKGGKVKSKARGVGKAMRGHGCGGR